MELRESDPLRQFEFWYGEAQAATAELQPDAITLATATPAGRPSARMVLFKALEEGRFQFYTNYQSRKGRELEKNSRVALVFFWASLQRQVRVEGVARKLSAAASDAYWRTRPRESQLGGAASRQSAPIASYEALMARVARLERELAGKAVPRPEHWGGYGVTPTVIEFWQGMPSRLHYRVRYTKKPGKGWRREVLSP